MRQRTNQGGSVITFVIVAVVLTAVVATGVYLVNQRNKHDTETPQASTSSNQPSSTTSTNPQTPPPSSAGSSNNKTQTNQASKPTSPQASTPDTGFNGQVAGGGNLPTTGPADTGLRLIALGALVGLVTAYVRSHVRKLQTEPL